MVLVTYDLLCFLGVTLGLAMGRAMTNAVEAGTTNTTPRQKPASLVSAAQWLLLSPPDTSFSQVEAVLSTESWNEKTREGHSCLEQSDC